MDLEVEGAGVEGGGGDAKRSGKELHAGCSIIIGAVTLMHFGTVLPFTKILPCGNKLRIEFIIHTFCC